MTEDAQLLRQFANEGSEGAFRELVGQRIDFVYGTALRQVGGDTHLAQEVAQNVFLDLARKARALASRPTIAGWLYTSTRFAAAKALRTRMRRLTHETEAHAMHEVLSANSAAEVDWNELRPVIDEAMHQLGESDREAILLRYFDGRSFVEVGVALGLAENSARMRVERALEKLRERLARRGVTSTAAALGAVLVNQPVVAAPAGLAASVAAAGLTASETAGLWSLANFMGTTKTRMLAVGLVVALGIGTEWVWQKRVEARVAEMVILTGRQAREIGTLRGVTDVARETVRRDGTTPEAVAGEAALPTARKNSLARLQALLELRRRGVRSLSLPFFDDALQFAGALNPNFARLFDLTPDEAARMTKTWTDARMQLGELAAAHATTRRTLDGRFLIEVAPFEGGGPIYDQFMDEVASVLGPERSGLFLELMAERVGESLNQFGAEARTLTVESGPPATDGSATYVVGDQRKFASDPSTMPRMPNPQHPGTFTRGGTTGRTIQWVQPQTRAELIQRYGPIARLVPLGL